MAKQRVKDRRSQEKVVIGYLSPNTVHTDFMESVLYLTVYDMAFKRRVVEGGGLLPVRAGANLSAPRNDMVRKFLTTSNADWLWILDSDMVFQPNTLERLLEHADPVKAPIVGGLCFSIDNGMLHPTLFGLDGDDVNPDVIRFDEFPEDTMFQVAATGTGCLLVHRSVFEAVLVFEPPGRPGQVGFNPAFPWFQETEHNGKPVGEDITFCWRAGLCGFPVHVNTGVHVGHIKDRMLSHEEYRAQRAHLAQREYLSAAYGEVAP